MNKIQFTITAFNKDNETIYGSTVLDTASIETVLAINDEIFDESTLFQVQAWVDGKSVYNSGKFDKIDLDIFLDAAELEVEKVIE